MNGAVALEDTPVSVTESAWRLWPPALLAGVVAGGAMAVPMVLFSDMMALIGSLYGVESLLAGVAGHVAFSLLFAGAYAEITSYGTLKPYTYRYRTSVGLGVMWAIVLYSVAAGVLMPLWMQAIGVTRFSVPVVNELFLGAHLVYGVVLAVTFTAARRWQLTGTS